MLDVEERSVDALRGALPKHQAQLAGLKRLSASATAGQSTPPGTRRVFFSFSAYARSVIDHLKKCEVPIADGLSEEEFEKIEATYGFTFPPDLKGILQEGVPVGPGFPNWRTGNVQHIRMRLNLPVLGLLHEVATSAFWWKAWGPRPVDIEQAIRTARTALRKYPLLVPMYGHCYIASAPSLAGNPVFFVHQKNVVYCGYDVADFFEREAFRAHDCDPPFELDEWQDNTGSGRSSSGNGASKRGDLYHTDFDSVHRTSSSSSATDRSDTSGSGSSDSRSETWGRNLDVLAKNAESLGTPRSRVNIFSRFKRTRSNISKASKGGENISIESESPRSSICQEDIVRYGQIIEKPLPPKTLMDFSIAIPPWAALSPRRVEFWSELAEKQQKQVGIVPRGLPQIVDDEIAAPSDPAMVCQAKENLIRRDSSAAKASKWLTGYLEEMSLVLRQGGWEEDDITDMMEAQSSPKLWNQPLDAEAVLVTLAKEVELLSTSLKKAGWSVPDVTETMKMGLDAVWKNMRGCPLEEDAVHFAAYLVKTCLIEEAGVSSAEFVNVIDALGKLAARHGSPESLQQLVEIAKGTPNKDDKDRLSKEKKQPSSGRVVGPNDAKSSMRETAAGDPPGLRDQATQFFQEWARICNTPGGTNDKAYAIYISKLQSSGMLKGDDVTNQFFRILLELTESHCLNFKTPQPITAVGEPRQQEASNLSFAADDMVAKLVVLLVKVLNVTVRLMKRENDRKVGFHPRPYFRLFVTWLMDFNSPDFSLDSSNFQVLSAFAYAFLMLQPLDVPGFSFSWLELISHRTFMPKLLLSNSQKGWPLFQRLLVALFRFMEPYLRNADLSEPVRMHL